MFCHWIFPGNMSLATHVTPGHMYHRLHKSGVPRPYVPQATQIRCARSYVPQATRIRCSQVITGYTCDPRSYVPQATQVRCSQAICTTGYTDPVFGGMWHRLHSCSQVCTISYTGHMYLVMPQAMHISCSSVSCQFYGWNRLAMYLYWVIPWAIQYRLASHNCRSMFEWALPLY